MRVEKNLLAVAPTSAARLVYLRKPLSSRKYLWKEDSRGGAVNRVFTAADTATAQELLQPEAQLQTPELLFSF